MSAVDLDRYHDQGFALIAVMADDETAPLRRAIDAILLPDGRLPTADRSFHRSENQHAGDDVEAYGAQSKHYYFHLLTDERFLPIQHVFHHPRVLAAISSILGEPLIINNASLFAAEPGTRYQLGWHRDVIQIPEDEIVEAAIYSPSRFHNSVQINLPLLEDDTLWVVPGSHRRPNSAAEAAAFRGSKHYAPLEAEMPGAVQVRIPAGHAVLYNNNLIHRGHTPRFARQRRSLHLGYHCAAKPPTWHFYLLDEGMLTPDYRARMSTEVQAMIEAYFRCRSSYPRMRDTWAFCRDQAASTF
jgi:ectoine hydroxylase-related dioxygenase (phytanoyl-CoA dioxygenase family)